MSDFPTIGGQLAVPFGDTATAAAVTVTSSATANVMGAWSELLSADMNQFGGTSVEVIIYSDDSGGSEFLVNIGVGPADAMTIIPALRFVLSPNLNGRTGWQYTIPVNVPAGVAIYAQCQCSVASDFIYVSGSIFGAGFLASPGLVQVDPIGVDYSASQGTTFVAGAANTWGATVELTASTDFDYRGFFVGIGHDGQTSWAIQVAKYRIGIGAAGNEHWAYYWRTQYTSAEVLGPTGGGFVPHQIAAGTRIAVQGMANTGNAVSRTKDIILYGVR